MNLNGVEYYYIRNVQGDTIGLIDKNGNEVVTYSYDPQTGRYINADSQLNTQYGLTGMNLFCYGGNNPVNTIDPSGHCFMFLTAAIGAVVGAVIGGAYCCFAR